MTSIRTRKPTRSSMSTAGYTMIGAEPLLPSRPLARCNGGTAETLAV